MSSEIAIKVENLSKCYQIYDQPRDRLKQFVLPRLQRMVGLPLKQYYHEFWALKDVSFEVKKGETVGIIGRNGSGKSTLLQIICGTLNPSNGTIETQGRVAALLELGSGFNPEFTGRENVYMNAALLGLSHDEIEARYADIISFADIGDFFEQPLKTYSSGMLVRVAFAVIAHVDADILIVDEALAVGDDFFTQKCMRFLRSFMERGTVLFVSHDSASVKNLCTRAIWLDKGRMILAGAPEDVCNTYLQQSLQRSYGDRFALGSLGQDRTPDAVELAPNAGSPPINYEARAQTVDNISSARGWMTGISKVVSITMNKIGHDSAIEFEGGDLVRLTIRARALADFSDPILGFIVKDRLGQELFGENTIPATNGKTCNVAAGEEFKADFFFRLPTLQNGQYMVMVSLAEGTTENHVHHHYLHDAMLITVYSCKIRFGIVGIPFEHVSLEVGDRAAYRVGNIPEDAANIAG